MKITIPLLQNSAYVFRVAEDHRRWFSIAINWLVRSFVSYIIIQNTNTTICLTISYISWCIPQPFKFLAVHMFITCIVSH